MIEYTFAHMGINCANAEEARKGATLLEALFGLTVREGNSSVFAGKDVELMKSPYLGKNGHIAVKCNNVDRAVYHLGLRGVKFDMDSMVTKNGRHIACYMADEVGGFAIHLVQK